MSEEFTCEIDGKKFDCREVFHHEYAFTDTAYKDIITIMMPPKEFLATSYKQVKLAERQNQRIPTPYFSQEDYEKRVLNTQSITNIKIAIENRIKKLPIPFLQFNEKGEPISHEGRHTAKASEELGIKEIPVTIEKPKSTKVDLPDYKVYGEQYAG